MYVGGNCLRIPTYLWRHFRWAFDDLHFCEAAVRRVGLTRPLSYNASLLRRVLGRACLQRCTFFFGERESPRRFTYTPRMKSVIQSLAVAVMKRLLFRSTASGADSISGQHVLFVVSSCGVAPRAPKQPYFNLSRSLLPLSEQRQRTRWLLPFSRAPAMAGASMWLLVPAPGCFFFPLTSFNFHARSW